MRLFVILTIILIQGATFPGYNDIDKNCYEFYWRDYRGDIPSDAVRAGKDRAGRDTFVGQCFHNGKLTPGVIKQGRNEVIYEYRGSMRTANRNLRILCSRQPQTLVWVSAGKPQLVRDCIGNRYLIKGGDDKTDANLLAIGRVPIDGELLVSKVWVVGEEFGRIYVYNSYGGITIDSYEVLTFDPSSNFKPRRCQSCCID